MKLHFVSYGGGTNSTAMLIGMMERGFRPDAITFADTGGEKPHTYDHLARVNEWCKKVGFPEITIVKGSQPAQLRRGSLEAECLELGTMPSKTFGFGNCSQKWKIDPQNKFDRDIAALLGVSLADIIRYVGFDADEPSRAERALKLYRERVAAGKPVTENQFPLVEWDWGRDECVEAIERAGLPQPGKSSCWFCPSSKKAEVFWLRDHHPDLLQRAITMEQRALNGEGNAPIPTAVKGLGRHWSWKDLVEGGPTCKVSDAGTPEIDCGCFDGE